MTANTASFQRAAGLGVFLLFALFSGRAHAAPAAPSLVVERLNYYFDHPDAPETFRALTGQGDPLIAPESVWADDFFAEPSAPRQVLTARLFPNGYKAWDGACRVDYALATLQTRIDRLGADHPYVRRWIEAQRVVFTACARGQNAPPAADLPPALATQDPALDQLQTYDRAYQAASRDFYQDDREAAALAAFGKIAKSASPHRQIAVYMVAAIRAGSVAKGWGGQAEPMVSTDDSIKEIKAILADPNLAAIHPLAQQLLGWVGASVADADSRDAQVQATLAALEAPSGRLASDPQARRAYALARSDIDGLHLWDFTGDRGDWLAVAPPADYTASLAVMRAARSDPMAAWVLFPRSYVQAAPWALFPNGGPTGWGPLETYADKAARGEDAIAFAWRRDKLAVSRSYDADLWPVVEDDEAKAARGDQRATAALAFDLYHQVRLALTDTDDAHPDERFDGALAQLKAFPFKDATPYVAARHDGLQYLMTEGRIARARRWRDELPAPPDSAVEAAAYPDRPLLALLAEDEAHFAAALPADPDDQTLALQNGLSIGAMRRLAMDANAPALPRARFARVAWARAYALSRTVDGDLDRLTRTLNPEMTKAWIAPLGQPARPDDRRVLLDVLRSPALGILIVDVDRDAEPTPGDPDRPGQTRIDLYNHDDDNWWCAWEIGRHATALDTLVRLALYGSGGSYGWVDLHRVDGDTAYGLRDKLGPIEAASWALRNQDAVETAALAKFPCAPKLLTERVLEWVAHPGLFGRRDGQAEALALAVKTTHYGCYSDGPHGAYSKAAWTKLHTLFADTDWARQTKYWFNCPLGGPDCPARTDD